MKKKPKIDFLRFDKDLFYHIFEIWTKRSQ
jgi:hypothetical protein